MESGLLFPLLVNTCTRAELLETLLNIPCLIPTIETLLDNLLYLKPCAGVMKGLLGFYDAEEGDIESSP